jgi:hypothetical protein
MKPTTYQTISIPGYLFPVRVEVVQGQGFIAYRRAGREIFRTNTKASNK